ncbi:MAG: outer membrane beta-barrel family protein, partial [Saprospiraceae bacterium]|nr:outer membrane beta-barrel family protein [Saprospiraceae bacterium]
ENFSASSNLWQIDPSKTNQFYFSQTVHAFYSTLKKKFGTFGFSPGLRIEQAFITSKLPASDVKIANNYLKIYPSLHLGLDLGDERELRLNYSKRINRPDSDEHNPFAEYDDPRSREIGNPKLKPENIHSIEFGYEQQNKTFSFIPSLYYRFTYDAFTEIEEIIEDTILQRRYVNLDNEKAGGLELILVAYPSDDVDLNLSTNIYYNEIDGTNLGLPNKKSAVIWESKLASSYFLTRSTFGQINIAYRSSRLTPQGRHRPRFLVNFGFRQKLWKGKAALVLTISDLFKTLKRERYIDTSELYRKTVQERKTQIFQFGFNYQFGRNDKTNQTLEYEDSL